MAWRKATGRPIEVSPALRTTRALLRRHLRDERKTIKDLAAVWNVTPNAAYRVFYDTHRAMSPQYVDAAITYLHLDDFDARELRLRGAIEAGWQIDKGEML